MDKFKRKHPYTTLPGTEIRDTENELHDNEIPDIDIPKRRNTSLLKSLSEADREILCAALFRPEEIWIGGSACYTYINGRDLPTLFANFERRERDMIKRLPDHVKAKGSILSFGNEKNSGNPLCKLHSAISPTILSELKHKIDRLMNKFLNHLNSLQVAEDNLEPLMAGLRRLHAHVLHPVDYNRVFPFNPIPVDSRYFQANNCDGCILAAMSGRVENLKTLLVATLARRRDGGSLLPWIEAWLELNNGGERIKEEGVKEAKTIRKVIRRGVRELKGIGKDFTEKKKKKRKRKENKGSEIKIEAKEIAEEEIGGGERVGGERN
ncbi:hypothetical protein RUND412_003919 [Rhizina undulata]